MILLFRSIGESLVFAYDALRQNKLRTILSLLGITIGIFTIISVFSAVDTLHNKLQESVNKLGSNSIYVQKWPWIFGNSYPWWKYVNRPSPRLRDYEALRERMETAEALSYEVSIDSKVIKYKSNSVSGGSITATTSEYNKTWNIDLIQGHYFTEMESKTGAPVCVLGNDIATGLFESEDPIGKQIKVMGRRVNVVGVLKKEGEDMLGFNSDKLILLPLNLARSMINVESESYGPQITVRGKSNIPLADVESELQGLMRSIRRIKPMQDDNFSLNKTTMLSNQLDLMFKTINIAGWLIGGFSILVGGFGIANIMFVSVKERTNIIGIQKSLGAKSYFILLQFLFEAIFLCLLGGLLGLILVFGLTKAISAISDFKIVLDMGNVVMGVSISVVIGMISGFWPAYSASRLDPVEAIRSK